MKRRKFFSILFETSVLDRVIPSNFSFMWLKKHKCFVVMNNGRIMSSKCAEAILRACDSHVSTMPDGKAAWLNEQMDADDASVALFNKREANSKPKYRAIGFVYLCRNSATGLTKIGFSTNPKVREATLQSQEPDVSMIGVFPGSGSDERFLHKVFKEMRVRGEWFQLTEGNISSIRSIMNGSLL